MNHFKMEFILKQHTPLIHFQSDQSGATLRATELKPKFDRYLIKMFKKEKIEYKEFLIIGQKRAFDYKVKIIKKKISDDKTDLNGLPDERLFMGNMGGGSRKQMYHRNFESIVILNTFNEELKKNIEKIFPDFIFQTNFGGGSSKGFGSFTCKKNKTLSDLKNGYLFKVNSDKLEDVYNSIFYFYKMLKSGINEYDKNNNSIFYGKSFLWSYVNNTQDNATWEKKKIKETFFSNQLEKQKKKYPHSDMLFSKKEPFLYRDLLGLSLESDWMSYDKATITKKSTDISRFPSPVIFKPILEEDGYIIYFWAVEVSKDILNKKFTVSDGSSSFEISTPAVFDIGKYLEFVSKQNLVTYIDKEFQMNNKIFNTLKTIFSSIEKIEQHSKGIL